MTFEESALIGPAAALHNLQVDLFHTFWKIGTTLNMYGCSATHIDPFIVQQFGPYTSTGNLQKMMALAGALTEEEVQDLGALLPWPDIEEYLQLGSADGWRDKIVEHCCPPTGNQSRPRGSYNIQLTEFKRDLLATYPVMRNFPQFRTVAGREALEKLLFIPDGAAGEMERFGQMENCSQAIANELVRFRIGRNKVLQEAAKTALADCAGGYALLINGASGASEEDIETVTLLDKLHRSYDAGQPLLYRLLLAMPYRFLAHLMAVENADERLFYCCLAMAENMDVPELGNGIADRAYQKRAELCRELPVLESLYVQHREGVLYSLYCPMFSIHRDEKTLHWWREMC